MLSQGGKGGDRGKRREKTNLGADFKGFSGPSLPLPGG